MHNNQDIRWMNMENKRKERKAITRIFFVGQYQNLLDYKTTTS